MPEPQTEKKRYRPLSELVKERNKASPLMKVQTVQEAPRRVIPEGAESSAFRRVYSLNADDCPYLGESFPAGTWTCWCSRTVYRNGFPLYESLKCFRPEHISCEEYRLLKMMGMCGYHNLRTPAWMPAGERHG